MVDSTRSRKCFNITGWRLAFAVGSPRNLAPLKVMKTTWIRDSSSPCKLTAAWALDHLVDSFGGQQRATSPAAHGKTCACARTAGVRGFPSRQARSFCGDACQMDSLPRILPKPCWKKPASS